MDSPHLLVPIKVQALVIDDIVFAKRGVIEIAKDRFAANDGRWSPQLFDYQVLPASLIMPGPKPFYGAGRTYQGNPADQLVFDASSAALLEEKDRGVYLHWVLPSGLRHAYTPGLLDFPALPDHWLIVRFARSGATLKTKAWFVDGGTLTSDAGPANLLFADSDKYTARSVGKVVPLEQFASANFTGDRTKITAIGNSSTGSPTFTAFIAENRNVFSWHDKLEDLRQPNAQGSVPQETALSYLLVGWYRDQSNEALASSSVKVKEQRDTNNKLLGWLIDPPGWFIETNATIPNLPNDLLKRRSVFHGMCAHINYWSAGTYKGQILGYPGAPRVAGLGKATPAFQVGVGNNAEDALVSLVSSSYSGEQEVGMKKDATNLWEALEAVIYRQPETLVRSWNTAPLVNAVHQNWFATHEAGKLWFIRPKSDDKGVFPTEPGKAAAQTKIKPTAAQLADLQRLNELQAEADAMSRDLAALQQELYARWWKVAGKSRKFRKPLTAEAKDVKDLVTRVNDLKTKRDQKLAALNPLPDQLKAKLPKELELKYDAAPRFWIPADPVIVVKNCGCPNKHQFPRPLPCRVPDQIVTTVDVEVDRTKNSFSKATGVAEIAAAAQKLPACPQVLSSLLDEGSICEQAIVDLAARSLPAGKKFDTADDWQTWVDRLVNDLTWDGKPEHFPHDPVSVNKPGVKTHQLVELWGQQPWSPLFLDWQITWFPNADLPATEDGFGPVWPLRKFDYVPLDRNSIPATGFTIRGRSLISPIDGRIFDEPIETLRELIQEKPVQRSDGNPAFPKAVADVLKRYEVVWDKTLGELQTSGLMGQALTGFHNALLRRDVTLPRVEPDPARSWIEKADLKTLDNDVVKLLDTKQGLTGERLAPPTPTPEPNEPPTFSYSMVRAGALRIDELWLIDDFGQSADLLGLTSARSKSMGQIFHPRMRWHNDQAVVAMPPRVLQPSRLNFRFTAADNIADESDPALRPICGWIFFNPLDQTLVVCDRSGNLAGELVITKDQGNFKITWEAGAGGIPLEKIPNESLKNFAKSLIETGANPRLLELLNLIDRALERIRPAGARNNSILASRPLALVSATIGLELFGKAWTDPHKTLPEAKAQGTGDPKLDTLKIRVNLGSLQNVEDGLVGYFKNSDYARIVVNELPRDTKSSTYIIDPKNNALQVGFGPPEKITLLMDPWGSVQAACGLVPAKSITLAHPALDETVAQMETSFRVGPVLVQTGKIALPTPTGNKGTWNFSGPVTNQTATIVTALDPKAFSDQPVVATEGRLLLLNEE